MINIGYRLYRIALGVNRGSRIEKSCAHQASGVVT